MGSSDCLFTPVDWFRYFYNFIFYFLMFVNFVFYIPEDGHLLAETYRSSLCV